MLLIQPNSTHYKCLLWSYKRRFLRFFLHRMKDASSASSLPPRLLTTRNFCSILTSGSLMGSTNTKNQSRYCKPRPLYTAASSWTRTRTMSVPVTVGGRGTEPPGSQEVQLLLHSALHIRRDARDPVNPVHENQNHAHFLFPAAGKTSAQAGTFI